MKFSKLDVFGTVMSALMLVAAPLAAVAGVDELAGECDECHGKGGNSTEHKDVPSIAGFSAVTIEDTLNQYKTGDRKGQKYKEDDGEETDMNKEAEELSEADIKALAKHYAGQKFVAHKQDFDAALVKQGAKVHDKSCEKCHSEGGTNAADDAAILSGQWRAYLESQVSDLQSGKRDAPKKMMKKFEKLDDGEIKALVEYYVSQQ